MVNEKSLANLKQFSERTESEQRLLRQKGGIASGETRRLGSSARRFLSLNAGAEESKKIKKQLGITEAGRLSQSDIVVIKNLEQARKGSVRHSRFLAELTGDINKNIQLDVTTHEDTSDITDEEMERDIEDMTELYEMYKQHKDDGEDAGE